MCFTNYWKRALPFLLTFFFALFVVGAIDRYQHLGDAVSVHKPVDIGSGRGEIMEIESARTSLIRPGTIKLLIFSKPMARYTDYARARSVTGEVDLKVTFLSDGNIGPIAPITRLGHGLTEQAIAAAKLIKFDPATINGNPITVTKTVKYAFSIY